MRRRKRRDPAVSFRSRRARHTLRQFALNGTDHRSHAEQNTAIAAYIRWYNDQAQPKVSFAATSPIRSWTSYPAKVA